MSNMKESTNINRHLYLEWFSQIMYNHHQTGPRRGMFAPPSAIRSITISIRDPQL